MNLAIYQLFYQEEQVGFIEAPGIPLNRTEFDITEDIADALRKLRNYGSIEKYIHEISGYNSRLDEMQAAFLRANI